MAPCAPPTSSSPSDRQSAASAPAARSRRKTPRWQSRPARCGSSSVSATPGCASDSRRTPAPRRRSQRSQRAPHARVDQEIEHVGHQVDQDDAHRGAEHHALHDRIVAREYGIDDELAEAGDGEDLLGQHSTAQELAEQQRAQRHHRQQRIRTEEHTSELKSLMRIPYADFCLQKKKKINYYKA